MLVFQSIPVPGRILILLLVVYAVTSTNPLITLSAISCPFVLYSLLWKPNDSPFLFMAFMLQWLSITIKVFYSNYEGIDFQNSFDNYANIKQAYYYSLAGLLVVTYGVALVSSKLKLGNVDFKEISQRYNFRKLIPFYIIVAIGYPILYRIGFTFSGLQQPLTKLADFKWMVFFLLMATSLYSKKWKVFSIIAVFEIILSLSGFFSSFKDYFLIIIGGLLLIFSKNLRLKQFLPLAILSVTCVYMLIIWQYVKPSYRKFLNGGEASQTITRSREESLNKLSELVGQVDRNGIEEGFKQTVDRISYIDYFSAAIDYVPRVVDHTSGSLWLDAVGRVLQPRFFFPNKTSIDDSQATIKYTGIQVAGADRGTSISLGYMTENYIDFGFPLMLLSLFGYGLLIGSVYKYVMSSSPDKLIGTAMIIPFFFICYSFESALNKIVGATIMYLIIYELLRRYSLKWFLKQIKF